MLKLNAIYKTFNAGTVNEKAALNGLDLHLAPGDFVTVIGGNGAGKSTTLNAIAGTWFVDKGSIVIDGKDAGEGRNAHGTRTICRRKPYARR